MEYSIRKIAEIIKAERHFLGNENDKITYLQTDSRRVFGSQQSIFIAIKGERHNGHDYLDEVYQKGIRNFIVSEPPAHLQQQANYLLVEDTMAALQKIAEYHRKVNKLKVIGITGSNGKTIVKEWLHHLLKDSFKVCKNPKSYNSQIGVPLSVWNISEQDEIGIFEAGISKPGEMQNLQKIISPETGIFTNIGDAHAENFTSIHEKIDEKLKLFTEAKTLIYCADHTDIDERIKLKLAHVQRFCWSFRSEQEADLYIQSVERKNSLTEIKAVYKGQYIRIEIPFFDKASVENAIHCWAYMLFAGISNEVIYKGMKTLSAVEMRLEQKEAINHCTLVNDSYNSDLDSLRIALDYVANQNKHSRLRVILSDILQSGKEEEELYKNISALLKEKNIANFIGIGKVIGKHKKHFNSQSLFFDDTETFLEQFDFSVFQNELILLKGARVFGFERIAEKLQYKTHDTVLEINLNAVINNYNFYKSKLLPNTAMMVMIKAFGYGSGGPELAHVLQFHKADYLGVAYADEGIELRKAGISMPIMVMNPETDAYDAMLKYNMEPEIYSMRVLEMFAEKVKNQKTDREFFIHLKIDTGMHRLGFMREDLDMLIDKLNHTPFLRVYSVFSHLAASDDPSRDLFTKSQIHEFIEMSEKIERALNYKVCKHLLNTSAISRFPEAQFEMVRLGIGLHGITHIPEEEKYLEPVATLKTTVSQIKKVKKGENVGYGGNNILKEDKQIAIVPIGYADGYSRAFSDGMGYMLINKKPAKVIGKVCMDMCMLDVTGIDAKEGDEVIVFGKDLPIKILANKLNTIPYEILSNISRRVKRVYYQE